MADEISISGLNDLNRLAVDLGKASFRATTRAGLVITKVAYEIEGTSKAMCPVDTGNLRNGISTTVAPGRLSAEIGPVAEYAPYVEFGTSRMAPRAFMGPALDRHTPEFYEAMQQAVDGLDGDV